MLEAAQRIGGLPGLTYYCLFGLLSVTGLRMGEVLNLRAKDVDLAQGVLVIVGAKFGKTRLVPIHASTQKTLSKYVRDRDRAFGKNVSYFFVSRRGNRLDGGRLSTPRLPDKPERLLSANLQTNVAYRREVLSAHAVTNVKMVDREGLASTGRDPRLLTTSDRHHISPVGERCSCHFGLDRNNHRAPRRRSFPARTITR